VDLVIDGNTLEFYTRYFSKQILIGGHKKKYRNRITSDPNILKGKLIIKGTRIPVELILTKLGEGMTIEDLLKAYPNLTKEDILAAILYSADVIKNEELVESLDFN